MDRIYVRANHSQRFDTGGRGSGTPHHGLTETVAGPAAG